MCMKWLIIIRHVNSLEQCRTVSIVSTVSTVIARCYLHLRWYFSSKQLHDYIICFSFYCCSVAQWWVIATQSARDTASSTLCCQTTIVFVYFLIFVLLKRCTLQARQAEAFRLFHFSLTIRIQPHAQRASALLIIPVTALHYKSTTDVSELSSKYTDFLQNAFINSAQIYLSICFTKW